MEVLNSCYSASFESRYSLANSLTIRVRCRLYLISILRLRFGSRIWVSNDFFYSCSHSNLRCRFSPYNLNLVFTES